MERNNMFVPEKTLKIPNLSISFERIASVIESRKEIFSYYDDIPIKVLYAVKCMVDEYKYKLKKEDYKKLKINIENLYGIIRQMVLDVEGSIEDIKYVEKEKEELKEKYESDIEYLDGRIEENREQMVSLDYEIEELKEEIDGKDNEIDELKDKIKDLETNLNGLTEDNEYLDSELTVVKEELNEYEKIMKPTIEF